METVVKKWGNSLGIRIPSSLTKEYGMIDGSTVEFVQKKEGLVLVPKSKKSQLLEMLAKVDANNLHSEEDFGSTEGNEVW
ncbi:MAG: AbrB/MazE/SpoVT family DNA-binding domain-containing protein [Candidatus Marinimicrobia bacterium]|nr:AbrB/MazE/SpoVT family DNA-binding domain-containing protein [Candidatus Neomarinimicrobiota bacterium]